MRGTIKLLAGLAAGIGILAGTAAVTSAMSMYEAADESMVTDVQVDWITASSTLYEPGFDNQPALLLDYDRTTAWTEGATGDGIGEYVDFYIPAGTVITGGEVYPGFLKNEQLFYQNGAPTMLEISSGNSLVYLNISQYASSFTNSNYGTTFTLNEALISDGIVRVKIGAVRSGNKYSDTCISEMHFYGYQSSGSGSNWEYNGPEITLTPTYMEASSTLYEYGYDDSVTQLYDYNVSTCWSEGAAGNGVGEYVDFYFPEGTLITGGVIAPGFLKSKDLFMKNAAPQTLQFTTGDRYVTLDLGTGVSEISYSAAAGGYAFTLDTPLVCDGVIRMKIQSVRPGSLYNDACISEMRFTGYEVSNSGSNYYDSGFWVGDQYCVQSLNAAQMYDMTALASVIYKTHSDQGDGWPYDCDFYRWDLTSKDMAMGLYWYQYMKGDSTIVTSADGTMHVAFEEHMTALMNRIFEYSTLENMEYFFNNYTIYRSNGQVGMSATGDFGDAGAYYFTNPEGGVTGDGYAVVRGDVYRYSPYTGEQIKVKTFTTVYRPLAGGIFGGYEFWYLNVEE